MEIRCQIIFIKHRLWKIHELETFGTRKRILRKKLEGCSCARKRPVVFWTFHTFVCKANQPWTATKNSSREKNTGKCMESSKHNCTLSGTSASLQFFLKILFLVPKVSNSWIFHKRCFMKIIYRISIQTLLFQASLPDLAYSSKWRRKPW